MKPLENKIKFIYFDLGGVFFNWDNYFQNVAKEFKFDRHQIMNFFKKHDERLTKGLVSPQAFWEIYQKDAGIKNTDGFDFLDNWVEDFMPLLPMHKFAETLIKRYQVGVISNIYKGMYPLY